MPDKVEKPKKQKSKSKRDEKGVLAALPSSRPERIGTRRASGPKTFEQPRAAKGAARAPASAGRGDERSEAGSARPAAKKRATASRRKAAAPRTFEPTSAAEAAAGAADERAAGAIPPRPRAVREGAPGMGTSGQREQPSSEHGRPSGVELVSTAVQAAGELTQIGLTIGGQILKRAVDRLPKP